MNVRSDAVVIFFFLLIAIAYCILLDRSGLIVCGPEQFYLYHPLQSFWMNHLFQGHLPWFTAAIGGGVPLWSDPNLAVFYPGNLIHLFLPFNEAWNVSIVFHLVWGQCGIYWLCRTGGLSRAGALAGAFAFLFSAPALAALNQNELLITSSWVPWIAGLAYRGFMNSARTTLIAAVALACQFLGGFSIIQPLTLAVLVGICLATSKKQKPRIVFSRFCLLLLTSVSLASIQWIPAVFWIPHARFEWGTIAAPLFNRTFFYPGCVAVLFFIIGLRKPVVGIALACMTLDFLFLRGTPFFSFALAAGAAVGVNMVVNKYRIAVVVPWLIGIELLFMNWQVPQSVPASQVTTQHRVVRLIPDVRNSYIHWFGKTGALSPLAGLTSGISYAEPPEHRLLVWGYLRDRTIDINRSISERKSLQPLRDARIGYVISDIDFKHPELFWLKQRATKFHVYRVRPPLTPLVVSDKKFKTIQWSEQTPNSFLVRTNEAEAAILTIHRNALPGWKCQNENQQIPIRISSEGWMQVETPPGPGILSFTYRTPGAYAGIALSTLTILVVLRFLIL